MKAPRPRTLAFSILLLPVLSLGLTQGCSCGVAFDGPVIDDEPDAGPPAPDAGPPDAGLEEDAGLPDAGPEEDAGVPDAGPDAGLPDAGPEDAGPEDAGRPDAGPDEDAGLPDAGDAGFINTPPAAVPPVDNLNTGEEITSGPITLTGTDEQSPEGDLFVEVTDLPARGTLSSTMGPAPLVVTYTPDDEVSGTDSFTFLVRDPQGLASAPEVVTMTIAGENDPPAAEPDAYGTEVDEVLTVPAPGVLANDTDLDEDDTLSVIASDGISLRGAIVSVGPDGALSYDPTGGEDFIPVAAGEQMADTFNYTVSDGIATGTAQVTVTVTGANDDPSVDNIAAAPTSLTAPGSVILNVSASDVDGDTGLAYTYADATPGGPTVGISFSPAGPTPSTASTVSFAATVPRGDYDLEVTVTDGQGGSDTDTVTVTVANTPPTLTSLPDLTLLPGESAALTAEVEDPDLDLDDSLTWDWALVSPPAGVTLADADTASPTVSVDRDLYPTGPDTEVEITLTVTDDAGEGPGPASLTLTILDERGPYVDVESAWSGAGPNGACGARVRPCDNLADALVNLAAKLADEPGTFDPWLKVATRGAPYEPSATLVLSELGVRGGYDPDDVDEEGEWQQTAARTDVHSSADVVLLVEAGDRVPLEALHVEGVDGNPGADRAALVLDGGSAEVIDCALIGAGTGAEASLALGLNVVDVAAAGAPSLQGSEATGCASPTPAADGAYGVRTGSPLDLTGGNVLTGGLTDGPAVGLFASATAAVSALDEQIVGGDSALDVAGGRLTGDAVLTADQTALRGRSAGSATPDEARGLDLQDQAGAALTDVVIESGPSGSDGATTSVIGVDHRSSGPLAFVDGGAGSSVDAGDATTEAAGLRATCGSSTEPISLAGLTLTVGGAADVRGVELDTCGPATLTAVDATVTGAADTSSFGIHLLATDAALTDVVGRAGPAGRRSAGYVQNGGAFAATELSGLAGAVDDTDGDGEPAQSFGVWLLEVDDGASWTGGGGAGDEADDVADIGLSAGVVIADEDSAFDYDLSELTASAGRATSSSEGLVVAADVGVLAVTDCSLSALGDAATEEVAGLALRGDALTSVDLSGTSASAIGGGDLAAGGRFAGALAGVTLAPGTDSSPASFTADGGADVVYGLTFASLDGGTFTDAVATAGTGVTRSVGLHVNGALADLTVVGGTFTGGDAASSAGGEFQATSGLLLEQATFLGGSATTTTHGLAWLGESDGDELSRSRLLGGDCASCLSYGLQTSGSSSAEVSYVYANEIRAGAAPGTRALLATGTTLATDGLSHLRFIGNVLDAGGSGGPGTVGIAVRLEPESSLPGPSSPADFAGNVLVAGANEDTTGFWEECEAGALSPARHARPRRAENTNFHLDAFDALVRDVEPTGLFDAECSPPEEATAIATVNAGADGLAPYGEDSALDRSWAVDSEFAADGVHLAAGATNLVGLGRSMSDHAAGLGALVDVDGEARPGSSAQPEIGADELDP